MTSFSLTRGVQTTHADIAAGHHAVRPRAAGQRTRAHMLNPATRHGAALLDQMIDAPGADHRLQQRLPADDADSRAAAAAAVADAQA